MKFGKTLQASMISEWEIYYINYKKLKQCIKSILQHPHPTENQKSFETLVKTERAKASKFYQLRTEWCTNQASELAEKTNALMKLFKSTVENGHVLDNKSHVLECVNETMVVQFLGVKKQVLGFQKELQLILEVCFTYIMFISSCLW